MKLTRQKLRQIIKEELSELMNEADEPFETGGDPLARSKLGELERENLPFPSKLQGTPENPRRHDNFLWSRLYKQLKDENPDLAEKLWKTADEVMIENDVSDITRYGQLIYKKLIDKRLKDVIRKAMEIDKGSKKFPIFSAGRSDRADGVVNVALNKFG